MHCGNNTVVKGVLVHSALIILHPHARADRVAVAEDVVHAAHVQPEFVVVQALGRERRRFARVGTISGLHAASTRAQRTSSSRSDSRAVSRTAVTAMVSPTPLKTSME